MVKLTSIPSVSGLWLMPRLLAFEKGGGRKEPRPQGHMVPEAGYPDLRIELTVEHRHIDLEAEAIDLAIRRGRGAHPHRISVRLFEEHCYPITAPEYAATLGSGPPERLLAMPLIHDFDATGLASLVRAPGTRLPPEASRQAFRGLQPCPGCCVPWLGNRAGAAAAGRKRVVLGPARSGRSPRRSQPVRLLARPTAACDAAGRRDAGAANYGGCGTRRGGGDRISGGRGLRDVAARPAPGRTREERPLSGSCRCPFC